MPWIHDKILLQWSWPGFMGLSRRYNQACGNPPGSQGVSPVQPVQVPGVAFGRLPPPDLIKMKRKREGEVTHYGRGKRGLLKTWWCYAYSRSCGTDPKAFLAARPEVACTERRWRRAPLPCSAFFPWQKPCALLLGIGKRVWCFCCERSTGTVSCSCTIPG